MRRRKPNRHGAASVEMALVLPWFLALVFGCIEFSRISMIRNLTSNAAYDAARFAMVTGGTSADANQRATAVLSRLNVSADIQVEFRQADGQLISGETLSDNAALITVRVIAPYSENGFIPDFFPESIRNISIASEVTLRTNRFAEEI